MSLKELWDQSRSALTQFWFGAREVWERLSPSARANIGVAALATVAAIAILVSLSGGARYVDLFKGLDLTDANRIITHLDEQGVNYKLEDGNRTILVPSTVISDLRMDLEARDLSPKYQGGAPGFELFGQQDLLSNRWLQDMSYMRAVQGEVQRQLNEFDFIKSSRVVIMEAKEEFFSEEQKPSKAAVTLDVTRKPSKIEVKTILGIVSSFGGSNLHPNTITLALTDGTALHLPPRDHFASLANSKLELQTEVEFERAEKIRRAFEELGKKAIVTVSAAMSWDSITERKNMVEKGVQLSAWTTETETTSKEGPPEGAPGASANVVPSGMGGPGAYETNTTDMQEITNYQPTTTVTETVTEPGNVTKYSVTAIVDTDYKQVPATDDAPATMESVPLTDDQITAYKSLIASAIGPDMVLADVQVFDHPFMTAGVGALGAGIAPAGVGFLSYWLAPEGIMTIGKCTALLLFALYFRHRLLKAIRVPVEEEEEVEEVAEIPLASPEDLRRQEVAAEVERLAMEDPESVAALLRSWMAEED